MKRVLLVIVMFLIITQCKSQARSDSIWTEKYQQNLSSHLDSIYKSKVPVESQRAGLIIYLVTNLKSTLSNGLESISADSLSKIDCVIAKLKKEYPDKILLPMPKDQMIRIVNECREEIIPNNKKE